MQLAKSRRQRAKCHMPWALSEIQKNLRKTSIFHGLAAIGVGVGRVVVDFGARFGDFGTHLGGFGAFFGGFEWPLGAQRVDQGTLARRSRSRLECE